MAYTKTDWVDGQLPAINAENLNNIENGIKNNEIKLDAAIIGSNNRGTFAPELALEYPLIPEVDDFWIISDLTSGGYTFTTGDLTGTTANNFDKLMYTSSGFFLAVDNDLFLGILPVNSIAALAGIDPTTHSTVNVRGYYTPNDGGGGIFNYDSTQSAVNNGGTIINGWVRQESDVISVKDFGAKGDGVTDDLARIVACHAYVASTGTVLGFKKILFPAGTYVLSGQLNWGSPITAQAEGNVILQWSIASGIGVNVSTEFANWDTAPKQIAYNMNDSFIGSFIFENTLGTGGTTATGLFLGNDGVLAYSCESVTFTGLKIRGWAKSHTFGSHAYLLTFRNCRFDDNGTAIYNSTGNGVDTYFDSWERINYDDCTFAGNTNVIDGQSGAQGDFTINNCSLDYNTRMIASFTNAMIITICGGSHLEWNSETDTAINVLGNVKIVDSYILWLNATGTPPAVLLAAIGANGILTVDNNTYTVPTGTSLITLGASTSELYAEENPLFYGGAIPNYIDNSGLGTVYRRIEVVAANGRSITNAEGDKTQFFTIPNTALLANENKAVTVTFPEAFTTAVYHADLMCQPDGSADFYGVTQKILTGTPLTTTTFNIRNGALAQNAINITGVAFGK